MREGRPPETGAAATALLAMLLVAFGAAHCRPFSGPLPGDPVPAPYSIQHLDGQGTVTVEAVLGDGPRDVYLAFVNPQDVHAGGYVAVTARSAERAIASSPRAAPAVGVVPGLADARRAPTPAVIAERNQAPLAHRPSGVSSLRLFDRPPEPPSLDAVEDTQDFYDYEGTMVPATCRAVIGPVAVAGGERTLNVWVADNCWDDPHPLLDGDRAKLVTQGMVDALADRWLKDGAFNDIYDWVTGMLGAEWGDHGYADLIAPNGEITILLCDIDDDDSTEGGLVGYFYSRDNVKPLYEPHSNGRVMFTIDAVMYANGDDPNDPDDDPLVWAPTDYWPEEIFSTLAHEFQHMIHFYQRSVLRGVSSTGDRWINEMASQVVEDLLADKLGVIGPRGVDGADGTAGGTGNTEGRLPRFNARNDASLTTWVDDPLDEALTCYSITYAFGAWLARNYGGAMLLNRLMQCSATGPVSIEDIVSLETGHPERFARILQRWGAAQLLSDATDAPCGYQYNNADAFFDSAVNGNPYRLGSIDLFRYSPAPYLYAPQNVGLYEPLRASQALCAAAVPGTGTRAWTLDLPDGVVASVLVK